MIQAPRWDGLFHHSLNLPRRTFKTRLSNVMRQILLSGARVLLPVIPIWANAVLAVAGQPWPSHARLGDGWRSTERAQTAIYSTFSGYTCRFSLLQKHQSTQLILRASALISALIYWGRCEHIPTCFPENRMKKICCFSWPIQASCLVFFPTPHPL